MENLSIRDNYRKSDFNEEPVFYCKHCLSLRIRASEDIDYCDECGGTDIKEVDIHEWENMYEQKYGRKYLNNK